MLVGPSGCYNVFFPAAKPLDPSAPHIAGSAERLYIVTALVTCSFVQADTRHRSVITTIILSIDNIHPFAEETSESTLKTIPDYSGVL